MNRIVSGILRCVLALAFAIQSTLNFIKTNFFKDFSSLRIGSQCAEILIFILTINFVFYLIFNSLRDFKQKAIGLKAMYILFTLTILIAILSLYPFEGISGTDLILGLIYAVLIVYFIVGDFINLWLRKSVKINSN